MVNVGSQLNFLLFENSPNCASNRSAGSLFITEHCLGLGWTSKQNCLASGLGPSFWDTITGVNLCTVHESYSILKEFFDRLFNTHQLISRFPIPQTIRLDRRNMQAKIQRLLETAWTHFKISCKIVRDVLCTVRGRRPRHGWCSTMLQPKASRL